MVTLFLGLSCGKPDPVGDPATGVCIPAGRSCEPRPDAGSDVPADASGAGGSVDGGGSGGSGGSVDGGDSGGSGGSVDSGGSDGNGSSRGADTKRALDGSPVNELITDRWTPIASENAPSPRDNGAAVWTGQEMIVWGGRAPTGPAIPLATGARYNLATNAWTTVATLRAPIARYYHSAVWTGQEMIVWGGTNGSATGELLDSGARYNPQTDTWTTMSRDGAPRGRIDHVAAWVGTHMVIWGGQTDNLGPADPRRYDPATDTWSAVGSTDLPPSAAGTRGIWTGRELLLIGGFRPPMEPASGVSRYNPVTDSWQQPFPTENAPEVRYGDVVVWTGREAIVWGPIPVAPGTPPVRPRGAVFDAAAGTWSVIDDHDQPVGSHIGLGVFATGAGTRGTGLMLVVGGAYQGGAYDPASDRWWPIAMQGSVGGQFAFWTGTQMLVWGAGDAGGGTYVSMGARYQP